MRQGEVKEWVRGDSHVLCKVPAQRVWVHSSSGEGAIWMIRFLAENASS